MGKTEPEITLQEKTLLQYLKREWKLPSLHYTRPPAQIQGGFETTIYQFQLTDPPAKIPTNLVLRLFPQHASPNKSLWEAIVQNAVADLGIPAPRVFLSCLDSSILGGQFNIMEYISGKPMIDTYTNDVPALLGRMHARLHEFDPVPLTNQLAKNGFIAKRFSFQGRLDGMQKQIDKGGYDWLTPGFQWLLDNKPVTMKPVICHGDFHPLNILMHKGRISGVLDWSGFRIADPAYDVASTKVVLSIFAPILSPNLLSSDFLERYLTAYQTSQPLDANKLEYFVMVRLILGLVDGADGQVILRRKDIITQMYNTLKAHTGLDINIPKY
jgi:aminoglycoside phosphotransferase (APT) family kinase protein